MVRVLNEKLIPPPRGPHLKRSVATRAGAAPWTARVWNVPSRSTSSWMVLVGARQ